MSKKKSQTASEKRLDAYDLWGRFGITKHLGALPATKKLIEMCKIKAGQLVLDIGCGTGNTACILAKSFGANVIAIDRNSMILGHAKKRIAKEGLNQMEIIQADAHNLPFPSNFFDAVIIESVLVFCNMKNVCTEVNRVLKPGGIFVGNEATYLKPPQADLSSTLTKMAGIKIQIIKQEDWLEVFKRSGFEDVSSNTYSISLKDHFFSELKVDGIWKILSAIFESFFDPTIRRTFFNRKMIKIQKQIFSCVGYTLYRCRKPS